MGAWLVRSRRSWSSSPWLRSCTGPDGWPLVLEDRLFTTVPAGDPAWEARFTEAMADARFRCDFLNREESTG